MGVKDLWKLLEPSGRPVKLESLEGLVLGVDVSIWLNQAVKGLRDRHGEPVPNAHLIVLFNRICKLLYFHVKPVFVFDGVTPQLKQQTLASRSRRRDTAVQRSVRAADRQASKLLQAKILEQLTGEKSSQSVAVTSAAALRQPDMFQLPPIPEGALSKEKSPTFEGPFASTLVTNNMYYNDVSSVNVHSDEFGNLPPEVQHEILLERQQIEKYSYHDPDTLPQVANDFSNYQLSRLMKRSRISQKLADVRKVLKSNDAAVLDLSSESNVHEVETSRIMSSEAAHYILVKGVDVESQSSQDEEEADSQSSSLEVHSVRQAELKPKDDSDSGKDVCRSEVVPVDNRLTESWSEDHSVTLTSAVVKSGTAVLELESSNEEEEEEGEACPVRVDKDRAVVVALEEKAIERDIAEGREEEGKREAMTTGVAGEINVGSSTPSKVQEVLVDDSTDQNAKEAHTENPESGGTASEGEKESTMVAVSPTHHHHQDEKSGQFSTQTTVNETSSTKDNDHNEKPERDIPLSCSAAADEEGKSSAPATDITDVHTTWSELHLTKVSPPIFTVADDATDTTTTTHPPVQVTADSAVIESHPPVQVTADSAVIESDEGSTPSPVEKREDDRDVKDLLALAPSEAQERIGREVEQLERERTQQSRAAASVSNQMYKETQELMSLFGLPYIVAPTEAEAQCAALDVQELTQGTITDDNDVFLFGGRKVYRHFFSQQREVEEYSSSQLQQRLGLSRDQLIVLAYLLGSDYTEGLEGIGIVMAMEFLRDFPGSGLEPLNKFREWHEQVAHKSFIVKKGSALRKKLSQFSLPVGFPNAAVRDSYLCPEVDDSSEAFEWGKPDLDLLRRFAFEKMGWSQDKVDELLLPVIKRMNARDSQTQKKITQFMPAITTTSPSSSSSGRKRVIKSKRIRNVVARLTAEDGKDAVPKKRRTAKRTKGASSSTSAKQRQPAAKKRKTGSASTLATTQESSLRSNLSASSSSSEEDEFDSLVKDWKEEVSLNDVRVDEVDSSTRGKRTM